MNRFHLIAIPVIIVSAKGEESEIVAGLELGADDYVTKPFSPRQLMARVDAVLRRSAAGTGPLASELTFCQEDLCIDTKKGEVRKQGVLVSLTPTELAILKLFSANPRRIFSREDLIALALGDDFDGYDRTVDAHVKNLRQKIETDPRSPRYIVTVHGMGYRFEGE